MADSSDREIRQDVADLMIRYASGIDRRDWELLRSCFTDDCQADYGDVGAWSSGDEITEWMRVTHEPMGHTLHRISNVAVDTKGGAVSSRTYVDVIVRGPGDVGGAQAAGFYEDVLVQGADGWKIARRKYTMVRVQMIES